MVDDVASFVSRKTMLYFCLLLTIFGLAIWWGWGFYFGVWFDIGLYSVVAPLVAFGIIGMLLYSHKELDGQAAGEVEE